MARIDIAGRVVAVTGAARGIGLATAVACRAAGMKVAIGDLDGALAARGAASIGAGAVGLPPERRPAGELCGVSRRRRGGSSVPSSCW
jgi:NAD(P)-dependent dehydrogenase (short-subunit alcohol dehydrogenase family)